jgi:hypothetical protein
MMLKMPERRRGKGGPKVDPYLTVNEIRLVADLRIMHAKVDELYQITKLLQQRHAKLDVVEYADKPVLNEDIRKVDELYLWFVQLKEEADRRRRQAR